MIAIKPINFVFVQEHIFTKKRNQKGVSKFISFQKLKKKKKRINCFGIFFFLKTLTNIKKNVLKLNFHLTFHQ